MKHTPTVPNPFVSPNTVRRPATAITNANATTATVGQPAINNAGTVRVNNLANIETLFFGIGIFMAVVLPALGGRMICNAYKTKKDSDPRKVRAYLLGAALIFFGLSAPFTIDVMVASARDANLCGDMF